MSKHKSFGKGGSSRSNRSVLSRWERIEVLKKTGRWKEGENRTVTGLPKTQSR